MWDQFWSKFAKKCAIVATDVVDLDVTFLITDTNLYAAVVTLSTQDSPKLLEQSKSGFNWKFNWNRYK